MRSVHHTTFRRALMAGLASGLAVGSAHAVVVQTDSFFDFVDLPTDAIGTWGNNAAAVAIAPNWVLTTVHQDGGTSTFFDNQVVFDGVTYDALGTNQTIVQDGIDLRLARITDTSTGADADLTDFVSFYEGDLSREIFAVAGYGPTIGSAVGTDGYDWSGPQNNSNGLTWGSNRIGGVTQSGQPEFRGMSIIRADFDDASNALASVPGESTLAPGDSGGGWFIDNNGTWELVGLTSSIDDDATDIHDADAFFGQLFYAVDLREFTDEIQEIIETEVTVPEVPEEPEEPETPEVPETPEEPEEPETPETPETPEEPETPEVPETPETPEIPETPEEPEEPETPETPETPEEPETPEVPETPEEPETPEVIESGLTQDDPIQPTAIEDDGTLVFTDLPTERWIDLSDADAEQLAFLVLDGDEITGITGLSEDLLEELELTLDGDLLAALTAGDEYAFSGDGVEGFVLENGTPIRLSFGDDQASLEVGPYVAEEVTEDSVSSAVPSPAALPLGLLLVAAGFNRRRTRDAE